MIDASLHFRLIGEKTGNVARGINIAIVNCKLLNVFFKTPLKALCLGILWYRGFLYDFCTRFSLGLYFNALKSIYLTIFTMPHFISL